MLNKSNLIITKLSPHLFWDVDKNNLDINKDFRFVLARVLEYGLMSDWILLYKNFGIERISTEAKEKRSMDDKSMQFIAHLSGTKLQDFKCYSYKQSIPKHWNI